MTLPDHVITAAQRAYAETIGYQFNEVDFADSGIGEALEAGVQAALSSLWQPIESAELHEDIICADDQGDISTCYFDHGLEQWFDTNGGCLFDAHYWMPADAIPQPKGSDRP